MKKNHIPYISVEQMRIVDDMMISKMGITLYMMMENAGRSLAELALDLLKLKKNNYLVLAGPGNNGGGGLVAARHLINHGKNVTILFSSSKERLKEASLKQLQILTKMNLPTLKGEVSNVVQTK